MQLTFPEIVDKSIFPTISLLKEMILLQDFARFRLPPILISSIIFPRKSITHTPCPAQMHPPLPSSQKSHSSLHFQPHLFSASFASILVIQTPSPPGGVIVTVPFFFNPVEVKSASSIPDTDLPIPNWSPWIGFGEGPFLPLVSSMRS